MKVVKYKGYEIIQGYSDTPGKMVTHTVTKSPYQSGKEFDTFEEAKKYIDNLKSRKSNKIGNIMNDKMVAKMLVRIAEMMEKPHYVDPRLVKKDDKQVGTYSLNSLNEAGEGFDTFHSEVKKASIDRAISKYIVKIAKELEAFKIDPTYEGTRNESFIRSLTSFAPKMARYLRELAIEKASDRNRNISVSSLKKEWSKYLAYTNEMAGQMGSNKFHYYVVYSYDFNGTKYYVALNCSGKIGYIERGYDLTEKFFGGHVTDLNSAIAAINKHLKTKLNKGYVQTNMVIE